MLHGIWSEAGEAHGHLPRREVKLVEPPDDLSARRAVCRRVLQVVHSGRVPASHDPGCVSTLRLEMATPPGPRTGR